MQRERARNDKANGQVVPAWQGLGQTQYGLRFTLGEPGNPCRRSCREAIEEFYIALFYNWIPWFALLCELARSVISCSTTLGSESVEMSPS
jgi:hypothetical protein